jgi:hypothetical protein
MGQPGEFVLLDDGTFAVRADGTFAVYDADGECPECCGGGEECPSLYQVVVTGASQFQSPINVDLGSGTCPAAGTYVVGGVTIVVTTPESCTTVDGNGPLILNGTYCLTVYGETWAGTIPEQSASATISWQTDHWQLALVLT